MREVIVRALKYRDSSSNWWAIKIGDLVSSFQLSPNNFNHPVHGDDIGSIIYLIAIVDSNRVNRFNIKRAKLVSNEALKGIRFFISSYSDFKDVERNEKDFESVILGSLPKDVVKGILEVSINDDLLLDKDKPGYIELLEQLKYGSA